MIRKKAATFNGYYYLGISLYEQKKYESALEYLTSALRFSPHNAEIYYYIGM
jgi:tetratricopeptide (TPR) repeat protein